jgi:hypothetical protein
MLKVGCGSRIGGVEFFPSYIEYSSSKGCRQSLEYLGIPWRSTSFERSCISTGERDFLFFFGGATSGTVHSRIREMYPRKWACDRHINYGHIQYCKNLDVQTCETQKIIE